MNAIPDYIEPLRGYRVWRVSDESELESLCGTAWPPFAALEARPCTASRAGDHLAGRMECDGAPCDQHHSAQRCRCGIYAFSTRDGLLRALCGESFLLQRWPLVVGEVWMWGRVARHEYGYRAQYAYPAKFISGFGCDPMHVAITYGVPYEEDASCRSVSNSVEFLRSHCRTPFRAAPVPQPQKPAAATPILPAVWLATGPPHQTATGERQRQSRCVEGTKRHLMTRSCRAEILRILAMIRGSRAS
jgi:hypothetical protein